jgi:hypothetical protein
MRLMMRDVEVAHAHGEVDRIDVVERRRQRQQMRREEDKRERRQALAHVKVPDAKLADGVPVAASGSRGPTTERIESM